jgi:hypothetical protein
MEVVQHPVMPIEELLRSSSGINELSVEVSKALGISLSKVCAQYFECSPKDEIDNIMGEERECLREELRY